MLKKINLRRIIMKKTKKIISALLSIVFIAAFSITSNDSILVFKNLSISASAETTSSGFVYTVSGTTATITGYTGSSEYLTIPSTITNNGVTYTVTSLGQNAFRENSTIKRVYISSGIKSIGTMCFYKCSNLTYISIPNTIQIMYSYCFEACNKLTTVSFKRNPYRHFCKLFFINFYFNSGFCKKNWYGGI